MKNTNLLILYLLFFNLVFIHADSGYSFLHITGEDGLAESNVKSIWKDSYGFMWFGTKNGLHRYDGSSILQLYCEDPVAGHGNQNISALFEDENRLLWVGTDRGVFLYDIMSDSFTWINQRTPEGAGLDNWVAAITADNRGNIWVVIPDQGIFRYSQKTLFFYEITDRSNFKSQAPNCICVDLQGEVWVGTWEGGIFHYNKENDCFDQYTTDKQGKSIADLKINSISASEEGLVLGIQDGYIKRFDPITHTLYDIDILDVTHTFVRNAYCFDDEIWVGTYDGLYIVNEKKGQVLQLKEDLMQPFSLSDNIIYTMFRDETGGIWLGTLFGGVNYLPKRFFNIEKYMPKSTGNSLSTKRIRELAEDHTGNIWIGTEDGGVHRLTPSTGEIRRINVSPEGGMYHKAILNVSFHQERIYCGLFKEGMDVIDQEGKVTHYSSTGMNIGEGSVYVFFVDSKGERWIGNGWGLFHAPADSFIFEKVEEVGYDWVFDILEDKEGNLWLATMGSGVWKCNPERNNFEKYIHRKEDENCLSSNSVSSVMQDSQGRIWFSTDRGGICRYNPEQNNFVTYSIEEGLPDNVTYQILEDQLQNLWFGTNRGLVKFNPDSGEIQVFTTKDGLPGNQFSYKSALKTVDGKFYFGGIDGLIAFYPEEPGTADVTPAPLYISRLAIHNEEVTVHTPGTPLKKNIIGTEEIILPYDRSNISFDVVLLNYATNNSNPISYRLEPVDKEWVKRVGNQSISYAKLAPGKYTLRVKPDGLEGMETVRSLSLVILPPWWQSGWAYLIYFILITTFFTGSILWYKRRKELQLAEEQKLFRIEQEKELYESKVTFFTEIAHEIRTPLTLINGPLEVIREMSLADDALNANLHVIHQNTHRLLDLTSQLLDFEKIGSNKLQLIYEKTDIVQLLKEIAGRFEPTMVYNGKQLELTISVEKPEVVIDREKITKILSNLLSNALKYANENIRIALYEKEENVVIEVISDGEKIPAEMKERIFEPFYRIENRQQQVQGIGIGLSLARSLAELHGGSLQLIPTATDNKFVLSIPLHPDCLPDSSISSPALTVKTEYEEVTTSFPEELPESYTILLVEDNREMLDFIETQLKESFIVRVAGNGKEAIEIIKEIPVDLIVSDVMMPGMDGWEFCRIIKSDTEYCHIPIIFLTAKNDLESKIHGLKMGAEAYVEKPFSYHYLRAQIFSLLSNRRKEREAFARRPFFPVKNMQVSKGDEEFMEKVIALIEENLTNEHFGVEKMAEILCMSRSSLLRKIKVLFNLSPVDFIRLIRLRKAAELIHTGKYRLGEICYMVGIHSSSYFSKLFQKQFGMSPKEFEQQSKEKQNSDKQI